MQWIIHVSWSSVRRFGIGERWWTAQSAISHSTHCYGMFVRRLPVCSAPHSCILNIQACLGTVLGYRIRIDKTVKKHGCCNTKKALKSAKEYWAPNVFIQWPCKSFPRGSCSLEATKATSQQQLQCLVFLKCLRKDCHVLLLPLGCVQVKTSLIANRGHVLVAGTELNTLLLCNFWTLWRPIPYYLIITPC
jgi:hypothetical protein